MSKKKKNPNENIQEYQLEILDHISDGFVALDNNWCYTYVNKTAGEILGRNPEEMIGKNMWDEFPALKEEPLDVYYAYTKAKRDHKSVSIENYYKPFDMWFGTHLNPSSGGVIIYFSDITERKKTEEALNQNRIFIESIINASPDIIYIYDIEERKNIYVNEGIQINLGYTNEEIKQMGDQVIPALMHPEDLDYYLHNTYPRYATAGDKETITNEYRMKDKKGDWHWLNCKESIFLRKPDGTPKQIFCVSTDITERKKSEENLREAHQRLTQHLNNTPLAVIEWDKNMIIQKWSPQAENIFGWSETEVLKKHFNEFNLVFEDDVGAVGFIAQELMTGAVDQNKIINRNNTKSGKVIYCQWFNSVLKDEQGNVTSILSLIKDITERKKSELILAGEKKVLEMIAAEKPLQEILDTVVLNYESYSENAFCSIQLLNEEGTHIRHGAGPSLPDAYNKGIDGEPIGPVAGSCGTAAYRKERVIVSDIATDPLWENYRDFALSFGLKASWSTPIINAEGKVYGTFAIYYRESRTPAEADLTLIDRAANQVKIVLERYYNEALIKESEEKYRTLVEQASDAIFIADTSGRFITVNTSACKLAQYSEEKLLQMSIYDFAIMEDIQKNPFHFDELKQGKTVITERVMKGKDAVTLNVEITAKLLSDGRLLAFVRNITERKKAEEKIIASEKKLRNSLDKMIEGVLIVDFDLKYIYLNDHAEKISQYPKEELIGYKMTEKYPGVENTEIYKALIKCLNERERQHLETEFTFPDGKSNWFQVSLQPVEEGVFILYFDISERKKAEMALVESENHLRTILQAEPECVKILGLKGELLSMNPAGLAMIEADNEEQVLGHQMTELVNTKYQTAFNRLSKDVFNGNSGKLEFEVTGLKGGHRWLETHAVPLKNAEGKITSLLGVTRDITERKKTEEKIIQLNQELEQRVKERTAELEKANVELKEINDLFVGRESRVIELKEEMEALKNKI